MRQTFIKYLTAKLIFFDKYNTLFSPFLIIGRKKHPKALLFHLYTEIAELFRKTNKFIETQNFPKNNLICLKK